MPTPNTVASADWALKQNYDHKTIKSEYSRKYPLLNLLRKKGNVTGNPHKVPVRTSDGAGVSSDYVSAAASATGVSGTAFMIEMCDFVGVVPLDHKLLETAKSDGSFFDFLKAENDAKINGIGRQTSALLFGSGGGAIGKGATLSGSTLTLSKQSDAMNFWPGMQIEASSADGSNPADTLRSGGTVGYLTVGSVNRDLGTVTWTAATPATDLSGYTQTDYLFVRGTFAGNVSQKRTFKGVGAWFTAADPTDTFWNVARTTRPELGGWRLPSADQVGGVVQRIRKGCVHGNATYGATPGTIVLHPKQWEAASIALEGERPVTKTGTTGYQYLELLTGYGPVELISDPHCDPLRAFFLDLDTLWISHLGESIVNPVERDGLRLIPSPTSVGFEIRYTSYASLDCDAPWMNGSCPLAAV